MDAHPHSLHWLHKSYCKFCLALAHLYSVNFAKSCTKVSFAKSCAKVSFAKNCAKVSPLMFP